MLKKAQHKLKLTIIIYCWMWPHKVETLGL